MGNYYKAFFSLLVFCCCFSPVLAEESKPSEPPKTEDGSGKIIDYLEKQKKEADKKEKEKQKLEKEKLEKEIKEAQYTKTFQGSTDVIQGYASKYGYYLTGYRTFNVSHSYRYEYYGYYFTDDTMFKLNGSRLEFKNGKGLYVVCRDGTCSTSNVSNYINLPSWQDERSNIDDLDCPAYSNVDKSYIKNRRTLIQTSAYFSALLVGIFLVFRLTRFKR